MSTVNVVEGPVAKNFYFPGLGGAILFGNFNLGCPLDRLVISLRRTTIFPFLLDRTLAPSKRVRSLRPHGHGPQFGTLWMVMKFLHSLI